MTWIHAGPFARDPLTAATTAKQMRQDVAESLADPLVWQTAQQIVAGVAPRDEVNQARAIHTWLTSPGRYRFVNSPVNVQLLETPAWQLKQIQQQGFVQGNCADAAELSAALLEAIGIRCVFIVVSFPRRPNEFSHVFTVAYANNHGQIVPTAVAHPKALGFPIVAEEFDITRPTDIQRITFVKHQQFPA